MKTDNYLYSVEVPMPGYPGGYLPIVRAASPEGAAECVRVLLAQKDKNITEIVVRVVANLER